MEPVKTHTLEADASRTETTSVSFRTFPGDRTAPRAAAAWLRSLSTGLSPSRLADAELCMDELVTNVVRYAWMESEGTLHSLTVSVEQAGPEVEITVEDDGRPFDPTTAPVSPIARTLEDALPGGRGLFLVRSIAPRAEYRRRGALNRTTIAFPVDGPTDV
jgi:serine/threonine-protein kinase RsbW